MTFSLFVNGNLLWLLAIISVVMLVSIFVLCPLILAVIATLMHICIPNKNQTPYNHLYHSALYTGRVWHTRFHPKRHAFQYPIFMFALDLTEIHIFRQLLWPLVPFILDFRPQDHLKNGEGITQNSNHDIVADDNDDGDDDDKNCTHSNNALVDRIFRLVAKKTNNNFSPTHSTHRVILLTHLCYYGYNFSPVSFYYIVKADNKVTVTVDAIVGEVSNTPWTEMYCYVLHPDSVDHVQQRIQLDPTAISGGLSVTKYHYSFPKTFHVSPFMEMDYWYDWTFLGIPQQIQRKHITNNYNGNNTAASTTTSTTSSSQHTNSITIVNTLRKRSNDKVSFTAKLIMDAQPISPITVTWQMIRFPFFCMLIQIWIHYQAALLFVKGIIYVPHPQGSETAASKVIATIMVPFFAIREYINPRSKKDE
jgi:uncharacterized protein